MRGRGFVCFWCFWLEIQSVALGFTTAAPLSFKLKDQVDAAQTVK